MNVDKALRLTQEDDLRTESQAREAAEALAGEVLRLRAGLVPTEPPEGTHRRRCAACGQVNDYIDGGLHFCRSCGVLDTRRMEPTGGTPDA